jgi:hypothetical protein
MVHSTLLSLLALNVTCAFLAPPPRLRKMKSVRVKV